MYKLFFTLAACAALFACSSKQKQVADEQTISTMLQQQSKQQAAALKRIDEDVQFWKNRLAANANDISAQIKLASLYSARFQYSGAIEDIHNSNRLYMAANHLHKYISSGIYRSLAANAVTQHRFLDADRYLDTAASMGDDKYVTVLQQFDVKLELGDYYKAEQLLNSLVNKKNFDYYIRASKLEDHKGNGEASVQWMEKAVADAAESGKEELQLWSKTNLADMYGHNNRINEAYKLYNEVLAVNPHYYHAWKGLAWIAFSNDHNTSLAKKILFWLKKQHPVPDYDLLLSDIAAYEQNNDEKNSYLASFLAQTEQPQYGDMYNKYIFEILTDAQNNYAGTLSIAKREVRNRPTPHSYELLAWSLYKNGQLEEATRLVNSRVLNKTFEPDALYHIGVIYKQAGNKKLAKHYLNEALESSFELGPLVTNEIKEELKTL